VARINDYERGPNIRLIVHSIHPWYGALLTNQLYKYVDKNMAIVEIHKIHKSKDSIGVEAIIVALGLYAGKKTIDLIFDELKEKLEKYKKRRDIKYEMFKNE
jgi:hypothetical protein